MLICCNVQRKCVKRTQIKAYKMLTVAQKCYTAEEQMNRCRLHLKSALSLTITFPFNNIIVSVATAKTQQPGGGRRGGVYL